MADFDPFSPIGKPKNITEEERLEITQIFKRALQTPEGEKMLEYLKSKTIDRKTEPFPVPITQDQMIQYWMHKRYREGQNNIVQQVIDEVNKTAKELNNG